MFERRNYAVITVTLLIYKRVAACGVEMAVCGAICFEKLTFLFDVLMYLLL
ncbi:MAG: hypothetical protein PHH93_08615 [Prolixibacteraceae bacterium]|nr:hypothetical protein [Prolixibacteraceae bacterium]